MPFRCFATVSANGLPLSSRKPRASITIFRNLDCARASPMNLVIDNTRPTKMRRDATPKMRTSMVSSAASMRTTPSGMAPSENRKSSRINGTPPKIAIKRPAPVPIRNRSIVVTRNHQSMRLARKLSRCRLSIPGEVFRLESGIHTGDTNHRWSMTTNEEMSAAFKSPIPSQSTDEEYGEIYPPRAVNEV